MRVRFAWYDLWVGAYWDRRAEVLYVCPLPTLLLEFHVGGWRKRRWCFHHDHTTGTSWIKSQLLDVGRRKAFWCEDCGKTWVT